MLKLYASSDRSIVAFLSKNSKVDFKSAISEVSDAAENTAGIQHGLDLAAFISRVGPLAVGKYVSRIQ